MTERRATMAVMEWAGTRGTPIPEALVNEFRWLRAQNLSLSAIAERTGVSKSTVGKYLEGEGEAFYECSCQHCGAEMIAFRPEKRFCDASCAHAAWRQANHDRYRANRRRKHALRWATDPAYREARLAYNREYKRRQKAGT